MLVQIPGVVMKLSKNIKPISYLKQNTAEAVREVNKSHGTMVITQNGEAKAVLMDIEEYEQTMESFALLKMLNQSKSSYGEGKHKSAKQAFTDIRKRIKEQGY